MKPTLFLACVVLLSPAVSFAKPPAATDGSVPVTMNVIVEGKGGQEPPLVTRQDLIVRQPNERREVNWWNPVGDKFSVAILIDDSLGAFRNTHNLDDIAAWIRTLPQGVPVAVAYGDNDAARFAQTFTTDHAAAAKSLRMPLGTPAAFTGIYFSLQDLMKHWGPATQAREIILVSDGVDRDHVSETDFSPQFDATIAQAQASKFTIFTLYASGFGERGGNGNLSLINNGQSALSTLASQTGGYAFFQGLIDPVSYVGFLQQTSAMLAHQYTLGFLAQPGAKAGFQDVKVTTELPGVAFSAPSQVWVPLSAANRPD
jgi:hypothetical protein